MHDPPLRCLHVTKRAVGSVVCEAKVALYKAYMAVLSAETTLHPLPQVYVDLLAPFYPNVDLSQVTFGHSNNQPANNATTDCYRMYFNDRKMVEKLQESKRRKPLLLKDIRKDLIAKEETLLPKVISEFTKTFPAQRPADERIVACIIGVT